MNQNNPVEACSIMGAINIHEAKTHLSRLVEDVAAGQEIVIAKHGRPVAKLVAISHISAPRIGALKGKLVVPDDFDTPLPADVLAGFEGDA